MPTMHERWIPPFNTSGHEDAHTAVLYCMSAVMSTTECVVLHVDASIDLFQHSNRMGISQTLHRISALKNRHGDVCGLTYRIGRHIPGESMLWLNKHGTKSGNEQAF